MVGTAQGTAFEERSENPITVKRNQLDRRLAANMKKNDDGSLTLLNNQKILRAPEQRKAQRPPRPSLTARVYNAMPPLKLGRRTEAALPICAARARRGPPGKTKPRRAIVQSDLLSICGNKAGPGLVASRPFRTGPIAIGATPARRLHQRINPTTAIKRTCRTNLIWIIRAEGIGLTKSQRREEILGENLMNPKS